MTEEIDRLLGEPRIVRQEDTGQDHWVPDNLSSMKKLLGHHPAVYGLPLFHLYYSEIHLDKDGISNRLPKDASLDLRRLHAFRIIVGITWNWLIAKFAGLKYDKQDLNNSITAKLRLLTGNKSKLTLDWHELLKIDQNDVEFKRAICFHDVILRLNTPEDAKVYFKEVLAKYAIQPAVLTMFIPLETQLKYRTEYGKNAIKKFKEDHQKILHSRFDLTSDIISWVASLEERNCSAERKLRDYSWLSGKQIQRYLRNGNVGNSKSKHKRK
jgi:hypothetical protein